MRFCHPAHSGRSVRLCYCLNLHPADTLAGLLEGLRTITLPLRERLAPGREFGVGMYVPATLARELTSGTRWRPLAAFFEEHGLNAFTWNAFPYAGFGAEGLKARVFEPTWADPARTNFTLSVNKLAGHLAPRGADRGHLSISTHTGWHTSAYVAEGLAQRVWQNLRVGEILLQSSDKNHSRRTVLALEPEPRANVNDTRELAQIYRRERTPLSAPSHLGTCLDACHAAVEFEDPAESFERATEAGAPLGKLQFTSALSLRPERRADVDALLALDSDCNHGW